MEILLSGFIATSLMTIFSYIVSAAADSQFREPQLLNHLIKSSATLPFKPGKKNLTGWVIHYSIGYLFAIIFYFIWTTTTLEPSLLTGAILGLVAGIIGMTGWKIFFTINQAPPKINYKGFYLQIVPAHVIFGIGAALPYLF